ncbi:uncharacterized protein EDB93DRAFT_1103453 [Suillus bovinus]|uniref:uncharacterized protein n=1 Tax=Suillus bovinus TaxID=48563 RepID=UPI001B8672FE|nr:uncharacterized protein EDB93DRAFT_1103453 [Suillus bovinus]KAG2150201.1 hypothetical protein EDB93DRAFT_1103453 [Suillus bovinus]
MCRKYDRLSVKGKEQIDILQYNEVLLISNDFHPTTEQGKQVKRSKCAPSGDRCYWTGHREDWSDAWECRVGIGHASDCQKYQNSWFQAQRHNHHYTGTVRRITFQAHIQHTGALHVGQHFGAALFFSLYHQNSNLLTGSPTFPTMPPRRCALNTFQTSSPAAVDPPINTPQTSSPAAVVPPINTPQTLSPVAAAPSAASTLTTAPHVANSKAHHKALRQYSLQDWSKPHAMGRQTKQLGSEVHHFFYQRHNVRAAHMCTLCKEDSSHDIAEYSSLTTMGTLHGHLLKIHLRVYITALERHNLKVGAKEVRDLLDIGWTLAQIGQELDQNPDKLLESFGSPPGGKHLGLQPRTGVSALADEIPDYTIEEMHRQLVKFIVVDDQVMNVIECPEFPRLLLLLWKDLWECDIPHWTKLPRSGHKCMTV